MFQSADQAIVTLSERVEAVIAPFAAMTHRLDTISGLNQRVAEVLLAELRVDMVVFPSAGHLASWLGLCPGHDESAVKRHAGTTHRGNRWLRATLSQAGLGATRTRHSAFGARYRRSLRHRGHKKAVVAVAHALLVTAYPVLAHHTTYWELGADYYDRQQTERATRRAVHALEPGHARTCRLRYADAAHPGPTG